MLKHVLVPLVGSVHAELALPVAARIAQGCDSHPLPRHVVSPLGAEARPQASLTAKCMAISIQQAKDWANRTDRSNVTRGSPWVRIASNIRGGPSRRAPLIRQCVVRLCYYATQAHQGARPIGRWPS